MAWAGMVAVLAGAVPAFVRFLFPRVLYEPAKSFRAGRPEDFPVGEVSLRFKKEQGVYIVRRAEGLFAVSAVCTHLGCTTNWFAGEGLFKCPCHGSNFDAAGDPVAGPAPQPLFRCAVMRDPDGTLRIDKARRENRPDKRAGGDFLLRV